MYALSMPNNILMIKIFKDRKGPTGPELLLFPFWEAIFDVLSEIVKVQTIMCFFFVVPQTSQKLSEVPVNYKKQYKKYV